MNEKLDIISRPRRSAAICREIRALSLKLIGSTAGAPWRPPGSRRFIHIQAIMHRAGVCMRVCVFYFQHFFFFPRPASNGANSAQSCEEVKLASGAGAGGANKVKHYHNTHRGRRCCTITGGQTSGSVGRGFIRPVFSTKRR